MSFFRRLKNVEFDSFKNVEFDSFKTGNRNQSCTRNATSNLQSKISEQMVALALSNSFIMHATENPLRNLMEPCQIKLAFPKKCL